MISETLDSLSNKELIGLVLAQVEQIAALQSRVTELEAKLGKPPKTPDNSSLPPSQGQKATRPEGANKQRRKGRKGTTRGLAESPDHTRDVYADKCGTCSHELTRQDHSGVHAYDHIDIPPVKAETTRVNQHKGRCRAAVRRSRQMLPPTCRPAHHLGQISSPSPSICVPGKWSATIGSSR